MDLVTHKMHLVTFDPDNRLRMRALVFKIRQGHFKTGCCFLKAQVRFIQNNVKNKFVIALDDDSEIALDDL